jgi:hypothetical protein
VRCKLCGSDKSRKFREEIALHFPGLKNLDKPIVWVFPQLMVCLDCGFSEFQIEKEDLKKLDEGNTAGAALG